MSLNSELQHAIQVCNNKLRWVEVSADPLVSIGVWYCWVSSPGLRLSPLLGELMPTRILLRRTANSELLPPTRKCGSLSLSPFCSSTGLFGAFARRWIFTKTTLLRAIPTSQKNKM